MKYIGSKRRISKHILPIILQNRISNEQWYVEPFAGGMNTISNVGGRRIANDINYYLIEMWRALLLGWNPPRFITREQYYNVKNNINNYPPYFVGWVGFIFSFRSKWFGGFSKIVETKYGLRNYGYESIANILKQIDSMNGVVLLSNSYDNIFIPDNSIIYCDPPYNGFLGYKDKINQDRFWNWVRAQSDKHTVFVSEYEAPNDFECIFEKEIKSNFQSTVSKNVKERLFKVRKNG